MSPLPSLYLETIQRASYIIVQRYSNIQSGATNRTFHQQKTSVQNVFPPTLIIVTLKPYLHILYDRLSDRTKNTMGTKLAPQTRAKDWQTLASQLGVPKREIASFADRWAP